MEKEFNKGSYGKNQSIRLIIALAFVVLVVFSLIFYLSLPLLTGKKIVLSTQPVDPFDILRGQYLTIGYQIGTIPAIDGAQTGDKVYVVLEENSTHIWQYKSASLSKPSDDSTFIRGEVVNIWGEQMRIQYGIEQYFFERDAHIDTRNMTVEAKVGSSGQARIVQLLQNNKPLKIEYSN